MNQIKIFKKSYYIENIYCSININNIENYLKRIEILEKSKKYKLKVITIPKTYIFSKNHLNWALFNAENRFLEKINISKNIFTESLMILSYTNQIKKINKNFYLKEGVKDYFLNIISEKKILKKEIENIKNQLDVIKEIKTFKPEIDKIIKFYKIKNKKNIENEIIEKMALSIY